MGNCSFRQERLKERAIGTVGPAIIYSGGEQDEFSVPLHDRQGRIQQGLESRKEEGPKSVCFEGDGKGTDTGEEERKLGDEREENP